MKDRTEYQEKPDPHRKSLWYDVIVKSNMVSAFIATIQPRPRNILHLETKFYPLRSEKSIYGINLLTWNAKQRKIQENKTENPIAKSLHKTKIRYNCFQNPWYNKFFSATKQNA